MLVELVLDPEIFPLPLPTHALSSGESVGTLSIGPLVTLNVSPDCTGYDEFFDSEACVTIRAGPRPLVPYGELLISERSLALACPSCQWTHLWKQTLILVEQLTFDANLIHLAFLGDGCVL